MPEESQVERSENQDNSNIHHQPFPESVSEEHEVYSDYNRCHRDHVQRDSYLSAHLGETSILVWIRMQAHAAYWPVYPGPRNILPGSLPVIRPSSITGTPFTIT